MQASHPRPLRRYSSTRAARGAPERDPCLYIMKAQILLCALLLVGCYAVRKTQQPYVGELAQEYRKLLVAEKVELPSRDTFLWLSASIGEARGRAEETLARAIEQMLAPRTLEVGVQQPSEDAPPPDLVSENSAPDDFAPEEGAELSGVGGWMGKGDAEGMAAPSSCTLSPITSGATVDPPVSGKVTSSYGWRIHPTTESDDFHRGVDIAAEEGTPVRAAIPGTVVETDVSAIYGNYVVLDHGNGLRTAYCHCDTVVAEVGQNLRRGELIATVGSTGIATGPHVHFEVSVAGKYYNPAWVLDGMNGYGI